MVRRSHDTPAWRVFGAVLGAFAIVAQLMLSGWLIVQAAAAADQLDPDQAALALICTHHAGATGDDTGAPPAPDPHGPCPACACPQSANSLAPLPASPVLEVLRPRPETMRAHAHVDAPRPISASPYTSRAPPFSA